MRTTRSDLDRNRESGVEPGTRSQSEASLTIWLAQGASVGTPGSRNKIWDKKSPL